MTALHITSHAVARYQERVQHVTVEQAIAALSLPIVQRAAEFGAPYVRLPTGQRIVIQGGAVVTVLPADAKIAFVARWGRG